MLIAALQRTGRIIIIAERIGTRRAIGTFYLLFR
jgi:hypothetical protein